MRWFRLVERIAKRLTEVVERRSTKKARETLKVTPGVGSERSCLSDKHESGASLKWCVIRGVT